MDRESLRELNIAQAEAEAEENDPQWANEMRQVIHQRMGWDTPDLPLKPTTESSDNPNESYKQLEADHETLTRNYGIVRSQNILQRRHIEFLQRQLDDIRASRSSPHAIY